MSAPASPRFRKAKSGNKSPTSPRGKKSSGHADWDATADALASKYSGSGALSPRPMSPTGYQKGRGDRPTSPMPNKGLAGQVGAVPSERPRRNREWTPWRDRLKGHQDAAMYVEVVCDHCAPDRPDRRCLLSAGADGSVRVYELPKSQKGGAAAERVETVLQRLHLPPPPELMHGNKALFITAFVYIGRKPPGQVRGQAAYTSSKVNGGWEGSSSLATEATSGDGLSTIFGGYENGTIVGWDPVDAEQVCLLEGHSASVTILVSCEGTPVNAEATMLSASMDGTVRCWKVERQPKRSRYATEPVCIFILEFGDRNPVSGLEFLPTGHLLASSWDGQLRSLNLQTRSCSSILKAGYNSIRALCASDDGSMVYIGTEDCQISSWALPVSPSLEGAEEILSWKGHSSLVLNLRMWRDMLISASEDCFIRLWEPREGQLLEEFYGHGGAVMSLCIYRMDQLLWSGSRDWTVRSWNLAEAKLRVDERHWMTEADMESRISEREHQKMAWAKRKGHGGQTKGKGVKTKKSAAAAEAEGGRAKSPKSGDDGKPRAKAKGEKKKKKGKSPRD